MPTEASRYDVEIVLKVTDVTPGQAPRPEYVGHNTWKGVNYGGLVGLEDTALGVLLETVGWGKTMAEMLGQPVPSDIAKEPPRKSPGK